MSIIIYFQLEPFGNIFIQLYAENGGEFNSCNNVGQSNLQVALEYKNEDIIKLFIQNGANVNQKLLFQEYQYDYDNRESKRDKESQQEERYTAMKYRNHITFLLESLYIFRN